MKWKRNIRKRKLAEGKRHINTKRIDVGPRATGPNCACSYKCFDYVTNNVRQTIIKKFNSLGEKHKQDIYIPSRPNNIN